MSLPTSWGQVVAFLTTDLTSLGPGRTRGPREDAHTLWVSLSSGVSPQRASPPGPTSLVPEVSEPLSRVPRVCRPAPTTVVGPAPQTHPALPVLPEMQRLTPID